MDKIIKEAREAFEECEDAESENRQRAIDDLRFARLGEQWPEDVKKARSKEGRPCLTINRMPAFIRQVTNDARQNKPSIKVHPVDDNADIETAKIFDGLIRNIECISNADVAYDTALDFAATMGFGYLKCNIDYAHDDTFDLDILIERVANPFTIYADPYSTAADSSDWMTAFETETLPEDEFKRRFPKADVSTWEDSDGDQKAKAWFNDDGVRIARYWKRAEIDKKILQLSDGSVVSEDDFTMKDKETGLSMQDITNAQGISVLRERTTKSYKVTQTLLSGAEILDDTQDWKGKYIPIVPVYGEEMNIEGERVFLGLINQAKDAQQMYNFWRTASTELVALAPKAPFIGPKGAFTSDQARWETANTASHSTLEYDGPVAPQRQPFAGVPAGALQEALSASDDMKSIMGLFDASLGDRSNETSGKAILARQKEGDVSTFHFTDNMSRAIRHLGKIVLDLIPHVYTGERIVRVLGEDGTPANVPVNQPVQQQDGPPKIYDLTAGKYDIVVQAGPNYTTKRQEAADQMVEMGRAAPMLFEVAGDLLAKNLDWPGADKLAERLEQVIAARLQPPGEAQNPELMAQQQKMQVDQQKAQQDMGIQQQKMDLQRQQAELDAQIKLAEHGMNMRMQADQHAAEAQRTQERHHADLNMGQEKAMHKMVNGAMESGQQAEGAPMHPMMEMMNQIVQSNMAMQQGMAALAQSIAALAQGMASPKRIVRDKQGKAVGVETVMH